MTKRLTLSLFSLFLMLCCSGCSEEWWTRSQPPSLQTLLQRANVRFDEAATVYGENRKEVLPVFQTIKTSLLQILNAIQQKAPAEEISKRMNETTHHFIKLEGKLSIGSRASLGELSGQFRIFAQRAQSGHEVDFNSFGLFSSRTISFLANELSVPAPVFG